MKKTIIGLAVAVVAVIGLFAFWQIDSAPDQSVTATYGEEMVLFTSAEGEFTAQYTESADRARVRFSDTEYELERTDSTTGARYESNDGQVVLWEYEGTAWLEINDIPVITDAVPERRRVEVLKSNKKGDPNANKYDFTRDECAGNGVDNDCSDPVDDHTTSAKPDGDPVPGIGITTEQDSSLQAKDADDDGDSVPTESDSSASNENRSEATDNADMNDD